MSLVTLTQWERWAEQYRNLPYIRKFPISKGRPASWETFWKRASKPSFVLESGKGGRYTYFGTEPAASVSGKGRTARFTEYGHNQTVREVEGEPLQVVKQWLAPYRTPGVEGAPPFIGGCVGFWGYDVARSIERLPELADDDLQIPDYEFMMLRRIWVIDLQEQALYCAVHTAFEIDNAKKDGDSDWQARLAELFREADQETADMAQWWAETSAAAENDELVLHRGRMYDQLSREDALQIDVESIPGVDIAFAKPRFMAAVKEIQRYIAQGDVFQVNLSVRQSRELASGSEQIYEWLRLLNPSPYMGMLRFADYELVSGSPELLVKAVDGIVETRPIAGTRPRGGDDNEDRRLAEELITNEKERAEHIMLVDLLRNDLGRVSRYGTVKVTDLMVIEYYSHVMHIVSHVQGKLAEGKDAFDVIAAAFPGGTITGAPKIRTMEIIEELEPVRRGPYTGSIGWIDYNGNMELNIIIRTLLVKEGVGYVQSGAGIVIDSVPEKEFAESLNKAKALWKAILYSESARS